MIVVIDNQIFIILLAEDLRVFPTNAWFSLLSSCYDHFFTCIDPLKRSNFLLFLVDQSLCFLFFVNDALLGIIYSSSIFLLFLLVLARASVVRINLKRWEKVFLNRTFIMGSIFGWIKVAICYNCATKLLNALMPGWQVIFTSTKGPIFLSLVLVVL